MNPIDNHPSDEPSAIGNSPLRIGVLSNLRAGQRDSKVDKILRFLHEHPDVFHLETPDGDAVKPALREMACVGIDILVLNGGDGTVQHALTHLFSNPANNWLPWIAPISGGRTNTISRDFGARNDPVRGLAELITANREGRLAERVCNRPVLRVEIAEGVHYGFLLGFGAFNNGVRLVHQIFPEGKARGTFGAGIVTGMLMLRAAVQRNSGGMLAPDRIQWNLDGQEIAAHDWILGMVSTLRRLILGIRPFWGHEAAPLQVTLLEKSLKRVARAGIGILRGRPGPHVLPENGFHGHNVREMTARLDAGFVLDGELFEPIPDRVVRVTAAEGIRFLRA